VPGFLMAKRIPFSISYVEEAVEHLEWIEAKHHRLIKTTIEEQLVHSPLEESRNRKPLEPPAPFKASWELRCGPGNRFRVLYEVDDSLRLVTVLAIGAKHRERLLFCGEEYAL
jgi:mRNA-degrading endonuclease RelE of RelBE toxin-antitoxin system